MVFFCGSVLSFWVARWACVLPLVAGLYEAHDEPVRSNRANGLQVNDFAADAVISQLLLLDSQDPNKVFHFSDPLFSVFFSLVPFLYSRPIHCSTSLHVNCSMILCCCAHLSARFGHWAYQSQWVHANGLSAVLLQSTPLKGCRGDGRFVALGPEGRMCGQPQPSMTYDCSQAGIGTDCLHIGLELKMPRFLAHQRCQQHHIHMDPSTKRSRECRDRLLCFPPAKHRISWHTDSLRLCQCVVMHTCSPACQADPGCISLWCCWVFTHALCLCRT